MKKPLTALEAEIKKLLDGEDPGSADALSVYNQVLDLLDKVMSENSAHLPAPIRISASQIDVIVTDDDSGRTFRRRLPIDYFENDNGVTISGETSSGEPVNIVLLSGGAIEKMKDLTGRGLDKPRCHD